MPYTTKKLFLGFFLLSFLGTFLYPNISRAVDPIDSVQNTYNAGSSVSELQQMAGKPTNKIKIPGLNYTDIKQVNEGGDTYLYIPFIGEYLSLIYRYLVVFAGLVAVIVIIIAGIQWTASGGNSSSIESAKNRIIGALTGLGLAVGSYLILYTINPELVNFRSLKIKYVVGEDIAGDHGESADYTGDSIKVGPGEIASADCPEVKKNLARTLPLRGEEARNDPISQYYKAAEACRKKCLQDLPEDKRSKSSGSGTQPEKYLGYIDCSGPVGTRSLDAITEIGIHEGKAPAGINWWWITALGGNGPYGSHYMIDRNGAIYQVADEKFVIQHGVHNKKAIGIDLDAGASSGSSCTKDTCTYTQAQYDAINKLVTEIMDRTSVEFDDAHIIGHCEVGKGGNDHQDPRYFDWSKIGPPGAPLDPEKHKGGACKQTL
ncbi:MAG: hypothetical protein A3B90_01820 [Candidatus Magasanikbacteria bacterium RIFCSPHIGHO2_02_FULL_41_13]|uniref:N-acetylmuramoyl-L-alanine amidase n=1 Tax=Candidatus Magasanikbacteria bacterium RIFCSPHIGHO2_02_FULL_41_13 TaxID=1798676 RepID=A0A1F6M5U7_9BACT|nr:MAG: hypothetical protein A3B90_01820 [Candidatus Magasanikbacteria bacterium RIFCSPHIGHO2_02_FULL_41_13]